MTVIKTSLLVYEISKVIIFSLTNMADILTCKCQGVRGCVRVCVCVWGGGGGGMAKGLESKEKKRKRTSRAFDRAYLHQGKLLYTVCVALT